ncbi:protein tyrosine phosphatase domain-containing protein 1 isoform X1 [Girardinichthys multiradiatus]|uniref:protein tyrosine phosphatase domain-containing protein 1 isoform X1 n=1 Tax=Girardinichthys multiradiatus TaxID=208333 RepID=UPI001FAD10D0|nr:protein tyrosine phosphatase domain-containing protein 1 isoform X1 [Girardinichthys multiradiatus]
MMPSVSPHLSVPRPSYSQARENLVRAIPPKLLCMLACGGKDCRYEGPECWKSNQQVIRGLFSSWVTDDIIAMARPSNHLIKKYNIIEQFQRLKIRSIINTQLPGEHAHCGPPLDLESGFTYSPQIFMDNKIYFYNFGMPDFGVSSLVGIIDGVKVLAFAVREGRVAVHCHAGLGRTGVLIACYLIYTLRISPSEAVHYVRIKRPRSIQTRSQINQVFDFARLLGTQLAQYPDLSLRHGAPFTLQHYLNRQALLLHGQEARRLRHTPKVGTLPLHYINLFMIIQFYLASQSTCISFLTPSDQVVYLLCVQLSCLALALASPSEVHAELEKRSAVRVLSRAVRETLVSKQYLPLLTERRKGSWAGSGSVSSWDEPLGFLERKHEVLLDKRSYSESDITKIRVYEDQELSSYCTAALGDEKHWYLQNLICADLRPVSPVFGTFSFGQLYPKQEFHMFNNAMMNMKTSSSYTKMSKRSTKKKIQKCGSNLELNRNLHIPGPTLMAREVAKAMAEQGPPGETVLQRSALLQEELNSSDCGWALLVTESDPHVLCCLLWTWLEKLRDPVLSSEDAERLKEGNNRKPLSLLKKPQRHTISCLLSCVNTVISLCPHREDAILQRLICALTRRPQEEIGILGPLMKVLHSSLRETFNTHRHITRACCINATI